MNKNVVTINVGKSEVRKQIVEEFMKLVDDRGSNVSVELFKIMRDELKREGRWF